MKKKDHSYRLMLWLILIVVIVSLFFLLVYLSTFKNLGLKGEMSSHNNAARVFDRDHSLISDIIPLRKVLSDLEKSMILLGLVDIKELDSSFVVDLKYSSTDNLTQKDIYGTLDKAYLQKEVAYRLVDAQRILKEKHSGLSLIILDAARPLSAQQKIWDAVDMPLEEKFKFVSNPKKGSIHCFGAAVDVSIVDASGKMLDMGTPFDYMGRASYTNHEAKLVEEGVLTVKQVENRKLLRSVMYQAGFFGIQSEWWHFNAYTREEAKKKFPIIP